jgi:hypothetical protein
MKVYTEDDKESLIVSDLIRYADHHRDFDRRFVDEIYDFLEKYEYITEKQFDILHQIYIKNGVEEFLDSFDL